MNELFKIAEAENIGIFFGKMSEKLKGYSTLSEGCYYDIFINDSMSDREMLHSTAHEMSHIHGNMTFEWMNDFHRGLCERRAETSAITYIVPYEDVVKVLKDSFIRYECEAAEELNVNIDMFLRAVEYYRSKGLPVRRCDFIPDWRQFDY
jgi:Zn-dependent peptidase ImmA (M78 family)